MIRSWKSIERLLEKAIFEPVKDYNQSLPDIYACKTIFSMDSWTNPFSASGFDTDDTEWLPKNTIFS